MILVYILFAIQIQDTTIINEIDSYVEKVKTDLSNYNKSIKLDLKSYSAEIQEASSVHEVLSISLTIHKFENKVVRLYVNIMGNQQDVLSTYYFDENGVSYVYKLQLDYKLPRDDEDFKPGIFEHSENKFYFQNSKLLRWINPQKRVIESPLVIMTAQQFLINNDINTYLKIASD